ncbi:MAG: family 78 glycoside hydrolase catalytic domain [Erysipelotrichaceae bacterium]
MINKILVNNIVEPLGFDMKNVFIQTTFSGVGELDEYSIKLEYLNKVITYDQISVTNNNYKLDVELLPKTEYKITVIENENTVSTRFETGMLGTKFNGHWIEGEKENQNNIFKKRVNIDKKIKKIRAYATAKGVYELYINGVRIGDEYLAPGFTKYDTWTQVQTYKIEPEIVDNNNLDIKLSVGDGWLKSRIGFDGGNECVYGDTHAVICDIDIEYEDGSHEALGTDTTWNYTQGAISKSGIYYGEDYDPTVRSEELIPCNLSKPYPYTDRLSLPIKIKEIIKPQKIYINEFDELIIDFGQNHSGWISFDNTLPENKKVKFEYSEFLEHGKFYRENLRTARAAFEYTSDGIENTIRPHFTYFGYQYAKVTGLTIEELKRLKNLRSEVIYSDIIFGTTIETDNLKVNRLIKNVIWGQKSNFVDIPTDCPQRDERLGWTGDANIFSRTASMNASVLQFFKKYMKDIRIEQKIHNGLVPDYAPLLNNRPNESAIWGDAITFIPWNMYYATGDTEILRENYDAMIDWVKWILPHTENYIWNGSYQYGDWLALDATNEDARYGGTDESYIATMYYYMTISNVIKSGEVLGKDIKEMKELQSFVKKAIVDEYITANGSLAVKTQTAYLLMLESQILSGPQEERVVSDLVHRIRSDKTMLQTGFAGTPLICKMLTKYGFHNMAMEIFLHEGYPGWLYCVNLGATTIWERWNSVTPDGKMSRTMMNSLNHYSYGAIEEWIIEYLVGIRQVAAARKEFKFKPGLQDIIKKINCKIQTSCGELAVEWQIENYKMIIELNVPIGVTVEVDQTEININSIENNGNVLPKDKKLSNGIFIINANINIDYKIKKEFTMETPIYEVMLDEKIWNQVIEFCPYYLNLFEDKQVREKFGKYPVADYIKVHNITLSSDELTRLKHLLNSKRS